VALEASRLANSAWAPFPAASALMRRVRTIAIVFDDLRESESPKGVIWEVW
jgi:hypothetical protein